MLVNKNKANGDVKFISYTGAYPNLCRGILLIEINGAEYKFSTWPSKEDNTLPSFWSSGGSCGFEHGYTKTFCTEEEWVIDVSLLPLELQKYAAAIDEAFNENVPYGCCGGCL